MIDNDFICELTTDLDIQQITNIVVDQQFASVNGLAGHQRMVEDIPYLKSIRDRLPFLSSVFNIYTTNPGAGIVMHTDAKRNCALNIPIFNTEGSTTKFYEFVDEPKLIYNNKFVFNEVRSKVKEVFSFTLTQPCLINNSIPHEVRHFGTAPRVIASWSIEFPMRFEQARELLKQAGY